MTKKTFFRIFLPIPLYTFLGWEIGVYLIQRDSFEVFKILNIIGLFYDLMGICILSKFISDTPKYHSIIPDYVAEQFIAFLTLVGFGMLLAGTNGPNGPSRESLVLLITKGYILFISPTVVFTYLFVADVDRNTGWTQAMRTKLFGAFFLITGIIIQIIAAFMDLKS